MQHKYLADNLEVSVEFAIIYWLCIMPTDKPTRFIKKRFIFFIDLFYFEIMILLTHSNLLQKIFSNPPPQRNVS